MTVPTISRRTFVKTMVVGSGTIAYLATALTVHGAGPEVYTLRIIHTNDHHARIEPVFSGNNPVHGGVSRRKTLIDAIRREGGNQLLLDAGDVFQGTLYFNQYRGLADLEFYNALKYDAMAVGNHEFDIGQGPLVDFARGATFPLLSANMQIDRSSPLFGLIKPWVVIWVGGQPIGIIGATTEDTPVLSNPGPGVRFTNYIEAVRLGVESLRRDGVNKIIALTHVGIRADRELARQVDGLSVIIGGHSHTPMGPMINPPDPNRPYPEVIASPSGKPVIVAHDWEWGRWLGDLTIGFDANGNVTRVVAGRPTEVRPSIDPDGGFENRIRTLRGPLDQLRATPVGETRVALNGARADVRSKETNLGNLIADSMLAKTAPAGAQLAIMNGGGIRTSIPEGRITLGQVLEVLPFGNTLVLLTLTGEQVKAALENGVSQVEQTAGRFPQVGGMRYSWSASAPVGSRITGIQVSDGRGGFVPIDPNASYRVVVNNFIAGGGDGYSVLQQGTNRVDTGFLDSDVLVEYLQARSPVSPQVEGRIVQDGVLPGVADVTAPVPAPVETPAALPRTGGESLPAWLLALAAAGAIGSGLRLRERAARIAAASERETVEVE
ncbi:MAG: 5'-nucleotidase C-terminal domain-containing protein [Roseiflexus sp.]|jgi:5'-nucleotidase/UDP-sugar diphosphatase|nr:5'-nucleotidase C-terminal domain-containing protein [Roseiflexus sp.]MBO9382556.1 5'-nucleotidase C-terminal domain-containing protein [Roseiflexus sp.]MBO9390815.1 5'-nucleotidase C-terminal domain-containing protein [Roseiflexus sp.]MBO9391000.1 5'-nucleotidase C-terminal domain-containing protein [Roseiflexus sp.]